MRGLVSPISSMKTVPRCATSKSPGRSRYAPVKLPRTCPNNSVSSSVSASAAQLTVTRRACPRELAACIRFATTSLPTPLSPVSSTFASHRAASSMARRTVSTTGLTPRSSDAAVLTLNQTLYGTLAVESICANVLALRFGCMLSGEMAERPEQQAILVVEDDVPLLQAVERTFREAGRTVVACSTFEEGRKALRTQRFAGLLTDVRLGAFNGLQLAVIARQLQPDMRLIVYSGFDDPVLRAEAERLRATYVVKPITAGQLLRLFEAQTEAPESKDVPS